MCLPGTLLANPGANFVAQNIYKPVAMQAGAAVLPKDQQAEVRSSFSSILTPPKKANPLSVPTSDPNTGLQIPK